jgi:hypothetical protein
MSQVKSKTSYDVTKNINHTLQFLPLLQLLLMRFVYFSSEPEMVSVFYTGLVIWLLFWALPIRQVGFKPCQCVTPVTCLRDQLVPEMVALPSSLALKAADQYA